MTKNYPVPAAFDGAKFARRYGLNVMTDFWISGDRLFVPDGLPDDPPIFEPPDPFVAVPSGIKLHHWQELVGWIGMQKVLAPETNGPHHECYYIVADTQVDLDALRLNPIIAMQEGQPAYVKNTKAIVVWDGTKWK